MLSASNWEVLALLDFLKVICKVIGSFVVVICEDSEKVHLNDELSLIAKMLIIVSFTLG